ncbi:Permease of the drug/metabolite transporter (DMT) superfamily [Grimontia indica]|uniref:Permease of the drug/metabolite transporter (DMT) superfamily n=1 Tax=Grimontia indica TaxID=1056512 RepID=R1GNA4_9GAMM|nr:MULTISPECIES: DMT family transporter [Grimontia]EOD77653.1 Permease of the drug/metabolite transporter (DMT) superfamily [Grimontia indica]
MKGIFLNMDRSLQGSLAILFSSILWGTTGTAAAFAPDISPLGIGAFSMGVSGLLLAFLARKPLKADLPQILQSRSPLIIGVVALAIYPLAFYSSMRMAGVAVGTVVSIASAPFMTVVINRLFGKANIVSLRWVMSFLLGTVGIVMLTFAESGHAAVSSDDSQKLLGVLLGLVAGLSYATYAWVAKQLIDTGVKSDSAMAAIFGLGALLLLPTLLFTGDNLFSSWNNANVSLYMALVPMFIGYLAFGFGLRHVDASKATLLTLFEPVVAACFAVLIVGEVIAPIGWVGMALIMICLVLQATERKPTELPFPEAI